MSSKDIDPKFGWEFTKEEELQYIKSGEPLRNEELQVLRILILKELKTDTYTNYIGTKFREMFHMDEKAP